MRRVRKLYRTTVGKKVAMAVSGLVLFGWVLLHMLGNLKFFQGPEKFNEYALWLREMGAPLLPEAFALWSVRLILLAAVAVHVVAAVQLWRTSAEARPVRYRRVDDISFSYASRTMRWGGVIIVLFVAYHLLHLTFGTAHPDFVHGDVYRNTVIGFQNPLVVGAYVLAVGALALHLHHGIWSFFQTVGLNHPRYNPWRRPLAAAFATIIFVGFLTVPVGVWLGVGS